MRFLRCRVKLAIRTFWITTLKKSNFGEKLDIERLDWIKFCIVTIKHIILQNLRRMIFYMYIENHYVWIIKKYNVWGYFTNYVERKNTFKTIYHCITYIWWTFIDTSKKHGNKNNTFLYRPSIVKCYRCSFGLRFVYATQLFSIIVHVMLWMCICISFSIGDRTTMRLDL